MTFLEEYTGHVAELDRRRAQLSQSNALLKKRISFLRTTEASRERINELVGVMHSASADEDELARCVREARGHLLELSQ